jgi:TorA maturation chaperone TorD
VEDTRFVTTPSAPVDEVDVARAQFYRLLASLLRRVPDEDMLDRLRRTTGDATEIGVALLALADEAGRARVEAVATEFFGLFIGVGRGDLLPYASFYMSGFLHERPLARVREDLARFGIERVDGDFEPEDHVATLFDVMAGLADGTFEADADAQCAFFERHLKPWIGRFFLDLEMAESSKFYRAVGQLGRVFTGIEIEAFGIGA